jgi:hypothetical protein
MESAYQITLEAIEPFVRKEITYLESIGLGLSQAMTGIVANDASIKFIDLDIISERVNLQNMWKECANPIAIVFREQMDDWYAIIPCNDKLVSWEIRRIPGRDHNLVSAKSLAEYAMRADFNNPLITVSFTN